MTQLDMSMTKSDQSKVDVQESIKAGILLSMAVYFAFNIASGNIANYINERFAWLSYLAVVIFALLGAAVAYGALRREVAPRGYSHTPVTWGIIAIVAIPLLLGTLIPSRPLGADAVNGDISLNVATIDTSNSLSKDPLSRNILDWLRLFSGTTTASEYDGTPADLVGFVYREPEMGANHFMVARFTLSCCVADANAIGIPVTLENASDFADGDWVRVQGTFTAGVFRDQRVPILQVSEVEIVDEPEHPYLYS